MLGLGLVLSLGKKLYSDLIGRLLQKLATRGTYSENLASSRSLVTEIDNAGVLDDATILLTPTAYSNTRVHSVKTYTGDELVTNGTFDTDLSSWINTSTHWQWSSGSAYHPLTTSFLPLKQTLTNDLGAILKITFDLTYVQGTAQCFYKNQANSDVSTTFTSSGSYTIITERVKANTEINFGRALGHNTEFYIDNVSVLDVSSDFDFDRASSATRINSDGLVQDMQSITDVELVQNGDFEELGDELVTNGTFDTDSDWTKSTGWSIEDGSASYDGSGTGYQYVSQAITTNSGSIYKINFDVLSSTGSNLNIVDFGSVRVNQTHLSVGNYTYYAEADAASENLTIYANGTDTFSIDNVSVQQVDPYDRWNVTSSDANNYVEFTEGFARLKFLNTSPITMLNSTLVLEANKTYELVVDVHDVTSGAIKIDSGGLSETFNTEGVTTRYLKPTGNTTLSFYRATANVDITLASVSVKDITFSEDVDLARINYDSNGENGHWLLEPTSTNLITYSENFSGSVWTKTGGTTVSATNILSPSGENNGTNITGLNGSGSNDLRFGTSINPSNKTYTASVFLKGSGTLRIQMSNNVDNASSTIVTLTSSWVRYDFTHTFNATTGTLALTLDDSGATATSYDIWGAQLEALSYATSYIPTYGSTVTRATETLNGSGNSTLINSTEGVLYAEIAALVDDSSAREITLSDGTANNRVELRYGAASDRIQLVVRSGGVVQSSLTNSTNNILNFNKVAVKWKANDFAIWINGVEQGSDTSGSTPIGLNELQFNEGDGSGGEFYGKFKAVAVFDRALNDDELELLTGITNYGSFNELAQANGYTII